MYYKNLVVVFCLLLVSNAFAQEKEIKVDSKITEVLVYLNGASVHRQANVSIAAGRTSLKFMGLSAGIDPKSIQAGISGNAKIISTSHEKDFLNSKKESAKIKQLKDSLDNLILRLNYVKSEKDVYEQEKKLLADNSARIGEGGGVKTAELTTATAFYRTKLKELNDKLLKISLEEMSLSRQIEKYNSQLGELTTKEKMSSSNVLLIVESVGAEQIKLDLIYLTGVAAWVPKYDIRTSGAGSPVHFEYRAEIFNGTGEDWDKVKLTLSTNDPTLKMEKPELEAWGLGFNYNKRGKVRQNVTSGGEGSLSTMQMRVDGTGNVVNKEVAVSYSEVEVTDVNAEFSIKNVSSVASDGLPYIVDISEYDLAASYNYYCVPKVDKNVFLIAKVVGWESLNLIEGDASVYLDGIYLGKSYIDTKYSSDTLDIFLGRDHKVVVNRVKKQDYAEERYIGTSRKESFIYYIDIRNTNSAPITIEVIDQIPIAQENEISVTVKDISDAVKDDLSGKLTWNLTIQPAETKKLVVAFSVKYPRNKVVLIRQSRKVMCPKFR